jgi:hypothetical protein
MDPLVQCYLKGEKLAPELAKFKRTSVAWWGTSSMGNGKVVKELCNESDTDFGNRVWDKERKLWGTVRIENVVSLIASGLWFPVGLPASKAEEVALEVKKIIDRNKRMEKEKEQLEERRLEEERSKRAAEAAENERKRKEWEDKGTEFSKSDFEYAFQAYGLREDVLNASRSFAWLGPRTVRPMARIDRWFNFTHNKLLGAKAVVERDFDPAFRAYTESQLQTHDAGSVAAAPKRKRIETKALSMEELRKVEKAKVKAIKDRLEIEQNDEHAIALRKITEKCKKLPPHKAPYTRACPNCGVKPLEQFLDCGCTGSDAMEWRVCQKCNCIWHKEKLPCMCL